jgi:demethylmenaquinone methyltransferase/2-methoxy-6-polyprenyl-1,4-benzoquinol methylase
MPTETLEQPSPATVDKSGARVRQMFGEIAGRYDLLNHLLSMNVDRYWRWRTVRAVPPTGDGPILDVCTGTGDLALAYYRAAGGKLKITGTDFCHPMLVIGAQKGDRWAKGEIEFLEADTQKLPFSDDTFQIVSVAFGLRNVSDTDQGLREMTRVCRPGGRVAVLEFSMPRWQPFRGIYGWYFRNVLPWLGQWLARNRQGAYNYLPASVMQFPEGEALVRRMEAAGLKQVTYRSLSFGIATLYVGVK